MFNLIVYNFLYDYYKDEVVTLEAFKAGEYDFRNENVAKQWATMYSGPNFDNHYIVKEEIKHDIPQGMQALVFNMTNPILKDPNVREALIYAMDFEWMNRHRYMDWNENVEDMRVHSG